MCKERGELKTADQTHHTTAAIWFRFPPPKFLLHCVPQKLHIAAKRKENKMKEIYNKSFHLTFFRYAPKCR